VGHVGILEGCDNGESVATQLVSEKGIGACDRLRRASLTQ